MPTKGGGGSFADDPQEGLTAYEEQRREGKDLISRRLVLAFAIVALIGCIVAFALSGNPQ